MTAEVATPTRAGLPASPGATFTRRVPERDDVDRRVFENEIVTAGEPVVMRGLVKNWPIVDIARRGAAALAGHLRSLDTGDPVTVMHGKPGNTGFFFYDSGMDGFNFERVAATVSQVVEALDVFRTQAEPQHIYAGPLLSDASTAKFMAANPLSLLDGSIRARLWLGNASRVAAHYDVSRNIACLVAGQRRFTLFAPDQVANLYMGPFEHTMMGPTVSTVDFHKPDYARFPKFRDAERAGMVADLEPGDAIYVPTLWWHHVESFGDFNLLVNHWWKPAHAGPDFEALLLAILGTRDQPAPERQAWRAFFDHFVFGDDASEAAAHLPPRWQTVTGRTNPQRDQMLLRFITAQLTDLVRKG